MKNSLRCSGNPNRLIDGVCAVTQVYHIARNLWSKLETRTVKNVCAPAAVIDDKIYIIGGKDAFLLLKN